MTGEQHKTVHFYLFIFIVYFPTVPGSYAPLVFVPGLFGIIYEQFYSDVLEKIASHGYILVGVDLDYPAATNKRNKIRAEDDKLFRLINWVSLLQCLKNTIHTLLLFIIIYACEPSWL